MLDPILRSGVETTIEFVARINSTEPQSDDEVPIVPSTLRNAMELLEKFQFELDISHGLQTGQFYMLYQPIVGLQDGVIQGFEALMRWEHPRLGFVPPDRFVDVAESMGSVSKLTEFALLDATRALRQISAAAPPPLFASLNILVHYVDRPLL